MPTITQMRRVFVHKTELNQYLIPFDLKERFFELMSKFYADKTQTNKDAFIKEFGVYIIHDIEQQDLYVPEKGLYDKRRDKV